MFLTIILLVQVGIAVGATIYEDDFKNLLNDGLEKSLQKYDRKEVQETWDTTQSNVSNHILYSNVECVPLCT